MWSHNIVRMGAQRRFISTFFELFPQTFPKRSPEWFVNQGQLRKEYRQLQSQFHPDIVNQGGSANKSQGHEAQSSLLNKAYHTLKEPLSRSQYMLKVVQDIDLTSDEVTRNMTNSNPDLLMKIIDIHEELMEIEDEKDVKAIETENKRRLKDIEQSLDEAYKSKDYDEATKKTIELKYWNNLANAIKEWAPGKRLELHH